MSEDFNCDSNGKYNPVKRRDDDSSSGWFPVLLFFLMFLLSINMRSGGDTHESATVLAKQINGGIIMPGHWSLIISDHDVPLDIIVDKAKWDAAEIGSIIPIVKTHALIGGYSTSAYDHKAKQK